MVEAMEKSGQHAQFVLGLQRNLLTMAAVDQSDEEVGQAVPFITPNPHCTLYQLFGCLQHVDQNKGLSWCL